MRWYRCFIRSESFPKRLGLGDDVVLYGFYTTRWVQAETPESAEMIAHALLRSEQDFALPEGYVGPINAKAYFEEIDEAKGPQTQGGATWFTMEEG